MQAPMTSCERVQVALRRGQPDRVPWCEIGIDRGLARQLPGLKLARQDGPAVEQPAYGPEVHKEIVSRLGIDNICYELWAPVYAQKSAGEGRLFYTGGMIQKEDDLSMLQLPDPHDDTLYADAEAFVAQKGEYAAFFVTRIGLLSAMMSMGLEDFCHALYDNRALVEAVLDRYCSWSAVVAERASDLGFDAFVSTDDLAHNFGPFFSPQLFRDLVFPRFRDVAESISIPWIMHSDGDVGPLLDDIIELGIAGLHPVEKGAMDIRRVKQDYGGRICVLGNVDMNILAMGTPAEVKREVRGLIRDVGPGGGYIITSGNSLADYLRLENVVALSEAVSEYGSYPLSCD